MVSCACFFPPSPLKIGPQGHILLSLCLHHHSLEAFLAHLYLELPDQLYVEVSHLALANSRFVQWSKRPLNQEHNDVGHQTIRGLYKSTRAQVFWELSEYLNQLVEDHVSIGVTTQGKMCHIWAVNTLKIYTNKALMYIPHSLNF